MTHWTDQQARERYLALVPRGDGSADDPENEGAMAWRIRRLVGGDDTEYSGNVRLARFAAQLAGRALLTLEQESANKTATVEALNERIATLEQERDAARRETGALRPVVEAAMRYADDWEGKGHGAALAAERGVRSAVAAYRAALASLPSSSTPSEEGPTP